MPSSIVRSFLQRSRTGSHIVPSVGMILALVVIPASANTTESGEFDFSTSNTTYAITAYNTNTTSGSTGVLGVNYSPSGKGLYGYAADTNTSDAPSFGVAGISQNGYGVYGSSYAAGVTAIYGENESAGTGVQGDSASGNGVVGIGNANGVYGSTLSASNTTAYAGVYGMDSSTGTGGGTGVYGQTSGNYGVEGFATGSGNAIAAHSSSGSAGFVGNSFGDGFLAYGVGVGASGAYAAASHSANVIEGDRYNAGGAVYAPEFYVQGSTANNSTHAAANGADVQISGDLYVHGTVYTDCTAFPEAHPTTDCGTTIGTTMASRTLGGSSLATYASKQSIPTIEDTGSAVLTAGAAIVRIDPAFASTLEPTANYHVFLTPNGDSRGLYVAQKTLAGFVVRENRAGRSTLAFDYRIVATPLGTASARRFARIVQPQTTAQRTGERPGLLAARARLYQRLRSASPGPLMMRRPKIAPPPARPQLHSHLSSQPASSSGSL